MNDLLASVRSSNLLDCEVLMWIGTVSQDVPLSSMWACKCFGPEVWQQTNAKCLHYVSAKMFLNTRTCHSDQVGSIWVLGIILVAILVFGEIMCRTLGLDIAWVPRQENRGEMVNLRPWQGRTVGPISGNNKAYWLLGPSVVLTWWSRPHCKGDKNNCSSGHRRDLVFLNFLY